MCLMVCIKQKRPEGRISKGLLAERRDSHHLLKPSPVLNFIDSINLNTQINTLSSKTHCVRLIILTVLDTCTR